MKVYVIEDELMAQKNLINKLNAGFPDIEVIGSATSVTEAEKWLSAHDGEADLIFMDVELSDGDCFQLFDKVKIDARIVMTTAYDNYAIKAFEVNSIDYLLKPIETDALKRAVERCRKSSPEIDMQALAGALRKSSASRKRFIVRLGDSIVPIPTEDVAYFYAADKNTWLVTKNGTNYIMDQSLDIISEELDKDSFFRISRNCIIAMDAIESISRQMGGRLYLTARPASKFDMTVSRSRAEEFLRWLEG